MVITLLSSKPSKGFSRYLGEKNKLLILQTLLDLPCATFPKLTLPCVPWTYGGTLGEQMKCLLAIQSKVRLRTRILTRSLGDSYGHRVQWSRVRKTWEPNNLGWKPGPTSHQLDDSVQVTSYFLCGEEFIVSKQRSGPCPWLLGGDLGSPAISCRGVFVGLRALATGHYDLW